jgi:hypothetical protein
MSGELGFLWAVSIDLVLDRAANLAAGHFENEILTIGRFKSLT